MRVSLDRKSSRRHSTPRHVAQPQAAARIGGLDGLRALAVFSVLLYHLGIPWLPSGHMGVVIFLVLTGYLVTSSIGRGKDERGFATVPRTWGRRLSRLWPPMALMIVVVAALCVAFNHVLLTKMRPDVLPALGLFENIHYILSNQSYFEALGAPSPLTHLWYLGLDAQFCLVWAPLAYFMFDERGRSHPWGRYLALVLALVSAILMGVLFDPTADPSRVYYGPDTRAFALLLGAWLGMARPLGSDFSIYERVDRRGRVQELVSPTSFDLAGAAGLVIIIAVMLLVPGKSGLFYYGLMLVVALCATMLVSALAGNDGILAVVFSLPPLTWLGERSYSLYLWHYPIILLLGAQVNTAPIWLKLLAIGLSLLAAIISYELVERPMTDGSLRALIAGFPGSLSEASLLTRIAAVIVPVACVVALIGGVFVPDTDLLPEDAIENVGAAVDQGMDLPAATEPAQSAAATYEQDPNDIPEGQIQLRAPLSEVAAGQYDPVVIGDSVPTALRTMFPQACPNGLLDAYVSRRVDQAQGVIADYIDRGIVGHIVVYAVFSNVPATDEQLDELVEVCGPEREIYLMNVFIPEVEQEQINDSLARCAERHDNVHLVDWHSLAAGHTSDWLYEDGEHLREPDGANGYLELICQSVAYEFVANGGNAMKIDDALQIREVVADIVEKIGIGDASLLRDSAEAVTGGAEGQLDYHDATIDQGADLGN